MSVATGDRAVPPGRTSSLRALLAGEIVVGSLINVVLNLFIAWLAFPVGVPIALWGAHGLALDTLPATVLPAFMMTLAITLILRRRRRAGLRVVDGAMLPFRLPRSLPLRAGCVALIALLLVAVPTVLLLAALWGEPRGWGNLVVFKLAFSVFHSAVLTPIVILEALREPAPRA